MEHYIMGQLMIFPLDSISSVFSFKKISFQNLGKVLQFHKKLKLYFKLILSPETFNRIYYNKNIRDFYLKN